jgi:hypothetical protein
MLMASHGRLQAIYAPLHSLLNLLAGGHLPTRQRDWCRLPEFTKPMAKELRVFVVIRRVLFRPPTTPSTPKYIEPVVEKYPQGPRNCKLVYSTFGTRLRHVAIRVLIKDVW